ncbi:MAG: hypothetical protein ACLSH8_15165 [Zhenhengia sp.]|jgi:hypothetical protein|uniref:hypothetical protein n=1 Tax=Zhenhengia sp. TaxID=2944208 RepID=UPI002908DB18|nr:hypothetical protein [Clostridiales bacterium]MDU6974313.1 hypothetical protein [Clostridiales bacterium]
MKKTNVNLQTIFLWIIAVMLTTLIIMIGSGYILARNMLSQEVEFVSEVTNEVEDHVIIIEE